MSECFRRSYLRFGYLILGQYHLRKRVGPISLSSSLEPPAKAGGTDLNVRRGPTNVSDEFT